MEKLYAEGTARLYADAPFLGIEIHQRPTEQQIQALIKHARAGHFDKFAIDTSEPWEGHKNLIEGVITPKKIRDAIDKAFAGPPELQEDDTLIDTTRPMASLAVMVRTEARPIAGRQLSQQVEVLINPTKRDLRTVAKELGDDSVEEHVEELRAMTDKAGNLYVWKSEEAIHGDVMEGLSSLAPDQNWHASGLLATWKTNANGTVSDQEGFELTYDKWMKKAAENARRAKADELQEDPFFTKWHGGTEAKREGKRGEAETWHQMGNVKQLQATAAEACVALGKASKEPCEYMTWVETDGPDVDGIGTKVGVIQGHKSGVRFGDELRELAERDDVSIDLHHNHPSPYALSLGDIGTLNQYHGISSVTAHSEDGGHFTATASKHIDDGAFRNATEDFSRSLKKAARDLHDLKLTLEDEEVNLKLPQRVRYDSEKIPTFLFGHIRNLALAKAGLFTYSYRLSQQQSGWIEKYADEYNAALKVADRIASRIKIA
jgi:hypothetical protein